jgi:hypothetical protein
MSAITPSDITAYTDLVPAANQTPNFLAALSACVQPLSDITAFLGSLNAAFDINEAVGVQLDTLGLLVGRNRSLLLPVSGIFFSLDTVGLGLDEGIWQVGSQTQIFALPDAQYRSVLLMKVANNSWNGSLPDAYSILNTVFAGTPYVPFIIDGGNKTLAIGLAGIPPDALTFAILTQGFFDLRPSGYQISDYITPSVAGPFFGLDMETSLVSGFDVGAWGVYTAP